MEKEFCERKLKHIADKCEKILRITPAAIDCIEDETMIKAALEILKRTNEHLTLVISMFNEPDLITISKNDCEVKK
jgi:hypothetical protein